ncbi:MAG: phosphotransferase family protein [Acidimicrobiales bacterium]|nr:phosphotransferase family protein [Acidimicrobiales bacterium]
MTATMMSPARPPYDAQLADALRRYVGAEWERDVAVDGLRRLAGGTAHETWAFDVHDGYRGETHPLVLRRDVDQGMLDTDLAIEFELLTALRGLGIAVPRPWWCDGSGPLLGRPFMIVSRVDGTDIRKHLAAHPDTDGPRLGLQLVRLQNRLHQVDDLRPELPSGLPRRGPEGELAEWDRLIRQSGIEPGPLVGAALAWLRDHLPPTREWRLVHGDFKTNNLLFGADGAITVLDWEMAHLGDPVEDLAWTMLWSTRFDLVGGLLSPEDYLAAYEAESGREIDAATLLFWRVLALVKLAAIFLTGVSRDGPVPPTQHLMGRGLHHIEAQLADLLLTALHGTGNR